MGCGVCVRYRYQWGISHGGHALDCQPPGCVAGHAWAVYDSWLLKGVCLCLLKQVV